MGAVQSNVMNTRPVPQSVNAKIGTISGSAVRLSLSVDIDGDGTERVHLYAWDCGRGNGTLLVLNLPQFDELQQLVADTEAMLRSLRKRVDAVPMIGDRRD